jgi:hypothetical protein
MHQRTGGRRGSEFQGFSMFNTDVASANQANRMIHQESQLGLAKTRPSPKPAHENPTRGLGWVLVSRPVGGLSPRKPNPRPKWVPHITQKSKKADISFYIKL